MKTRCSLIPLFNIADLALFLSWYIPAGHGLWSSLDTGVFRLFSHKLIESPLFLWTVAVTNNRALDGCSLLAIGTLMLYFWLKEAPEDRRCIVTIGLIMLLTAVVLNQLGQALIPVERTSPTPMLGSIYRVGELLHIPAKDASKDSFPGDHSMVLSIFSTFMLRYLEKVAGITGLIIATTFAFPHIMTDTHWLTNTTVGSMMMVLIGLPWWLMMPLSDRLVILFVNYLSGKNKQFLNK